MRPTFEALYRAYAPYVRQLVQRKIPPRDSDDLEQMCFIKIHLALPSYDPARPLKPWITSIVRRTLRDYRELKSRRCEVLVAEGPRAISPDCEEQIVTRRRLEHALATLDERQRDVTLRCICEGERTEDIAAELHFSVAGIQRMIQVARRKLASAMGRDEAHDYHLLHKRRAFLLPLGLALPGQAWLLRARSGLECAWAALRASMASAGASAGVIVALGTAEGLVRPSAPEAPEASPVTASVLAALPPPLSCSAPAPESAPAPLPSMPRAARPSPKALPYSDERAEHASLERIRAMVKTNPTAALASLKRHKAIFVSERYPIDRESLESSARARAEL